MDCTENCIARLWPTASLPLDSTTSYIAYLPSDNSRRRQTSSSSLDAESLSSLLTVVENLEISQPLADDVKPSPLHEPTSSSEAFVTVEQSRETPGGTCVLLHGDNASLHTRSEASLLFAKIVAFPRRMLTTMPIHADGPAALRGHLASCMRRRAHAIATAPSHAMRPDDDDVDDQLETVCRTKPEAITSSSAAMSMPSLPSLSMTSLPPLDFENLRDHARMSPSDACTARKAVDSITGALSKIRPYLYVSGVEGARDIRAIQKAGITHILNVAGVTAPNFHEHDHSLTYLRLFPRDDAEENLDSLFADASAFIDSARESAGSVLVHCHVGVSRSCAMTAAYLMMREGLTLDDAMSAIRESRPIAEPNQSFVSALSELEYRVRHGRPTNVLYRIQPHAVDRDPDHFVAWPVDTDHESTRTCGDQHIALDARHAWILARSERGTIDVLRGAQVSDLIWERALTVAQTMADEENRFDRMFAVARDADRPSLCTVRAFSEVDWDGTLGTDDLE